MNDVMERSSPYRLGGPDGGADTEGVSDEGGGGDGLPTWQNLEVVQWTAAEVYQWASSVCHANSIDEGNLRWDLRHTSGTHLLDISSQHFARLVGKQHAPLFVRELEALLESRSSIQPERRQASLVHSAPTNMPPLRPLKNYPYLATCREELLPRNPPRLVRRNVAYKRSSPSLEYESHSPSPSPKSSCDAPSPSLYEVFSPRASCTNAPMRPYKTPSPKLHYENPSPRLYKTPSPKLRQDTSSPSYCHEIPSRLHKAPSSKQFSPSPRPYGVCSPKSFHETQSPRAYKSPSPKSCNDNPPSKLHKTPPRSYHDMPSLIPLYDDPLLKTELDSSSPYPPYDSHKQTVSYDSLSIMKLDNNSTEKHYKLYPVWRNDCKDEDFKTLDSFSWEQKPLEKCKPSNTPYENHHPKVKLEIDSASPPSSDQEYKMCPTNTWQQRTSGQISPPREQSPSSYGERDSPEPGRLVIDMDRTEDTDTEDNEEEVVELALDLTIGSRYRSRPSFGGEEHQMPAASSPFSKERVSPVKVLQSMSSNHFAKVHPPKPSPAYFSSEPVSETPVRTVNYYPVHRDPDAAIDMRIKGSESPKFIPNPVTNRAEAEKESNPFKNVPTPIITIIKKDSNSYNMIVPISVTKCNSETSATSRTTSKPVVDVKEFGGEFHSRINSQITKESGDPLKKIVTNRNRDRGPKSWEFLMRLLADERTNPAVIRWEDESEGTFRLIQPEIVAKLWGARSGKPNLSYNNFARALRYHYTTGQLEKVSERQLVYRCGPLALNFVRKLQSTAMQH